MPAKKRITKSAIIEAAIEIVDESGLDGLNTALLTKKLNCSTQPIYLSFKNMDELKDVLIETIGNIYKEYLEREVASNKYKPYLSYGMGYIKFATKKSGLFKLLFMSDKGYKTDQCLDDIYKVIMQNVGITLEEAKMFHLENWVFVHGIATLAATKSYDFSEEIIVKMLVDVYQGLKERFTVK
jgi:AcrR family transcriptional regulator